MTVNNINDLATMNAKTAQDTVQAPAAKKIKDQKSDFIEELKAKNPENLHDLTLALSENGFCVPISKKLITDVLGENHAFEYEVLKNVGVKLSASVLAYVVLKMDEKTPVKDVKTARSLCYEYIKEVLRIEFSFEKTDYKLTSTTVDAIAYKAYGFTYRDKSNIKNGYRAKAVNPITLINILLKEVCAADTIKNTQTSAAKKYVEIKEPTEATSTEAKSTEATSTEA